MSHSLVHQGSASLQADLWGARAADWADHEPQYQTIYEDAITRLGIASGTRVLDLGCGSGVFLRHAVDRGAQATGLDASSAMIEHALGRVPEADLRVGDLQFLPYEDGAFDVVTAFCSFWFAADPIAALREMRRVASPGGHVFLLVFGRPERCQLGPAIGAVTALLPEPPRSKFDFHEPGVLDAMTAEAGLRPREAGNLVNELAWADADTLVRHLLAAGSFVHAVRTVGEPAVRDAILGAVAPFATPDGGYRLENEWRYLIAAA
jgi:SAM-dependent methyltransferase